MSKTYIKEENGEKVLYEEGFLGDRKIGELHENFDGSLETRNVFSDNYSIEQERDSFRDVIETVVPFTNPKDYIVESSEGQSGILEYESIRGRHEGELENRANDSGTLDRTAYSDNSSESSYSPSPKKKGKGLANKVLIFGRIQRWIGYATLGDEFIVSPNGSPPVNPLTHSIREIMNNPDLLLVRSLIVGGIITGIVGKILENYRKK